MIYKDIDVRGMYITLSSYIHMHNWKGIFEIDCCARSLLHEFSVITILQKFI